MIVISYYCHFRQTLVYHLSLSSSRSRSRESEKARLRARALTRTRTHSPIFSLTPSILRARALSFFLFSLFCMRARALSRCYTCSPREFLSFSLHSPAFPPPPLTRCISPYPCPLYLSLPLPLSLFLSSSLSLSLSLSLSFSLFLTHPGGTHTEVYHLRDPQNY